MFPTYTKLVYVLKALIFSDDGGDDDVVDVGWKHWYVVMMMVMTMMVVTTITLGFCTIFFYLKSQCNYIFPNIVELKTSVMQVNVLN